MTSLAAFRDARGFAEASGSWRSSTARCARASSGKTFDNVSPARRPRAQSRRRVRRTPTSTSAVKAARRAFEDGRWRNLHYRDKKRILFKLADLMERDAETLAVLESLDVGKPITNALRGDIPQSIRTPALLRRSPRQGLRRGRARRRRTASRSPCTSRSASSAPSCRGISRCIMAMWKVAPALAMGNSMVLKPAEQSPLTALKLGELALEAGLPPGVLNVVPGFGGTAGKALALHMDVDMIAFTGSGRRRQAADAVFRTEQSEARQPRARRQVSADRLRRLPRSRRRAATQAAWGIFYNQGEVCTAGSRLLVHESIADAFVDKLLTVARRIVAGDPLEPATTLRRHGLARSRCRRRCATSRRRKREGGDLDASAATAPASKAAASTSSRRCSTACSPTPRWRARRCSAPCSPSRASPIADDAIRIANDTVYGLAAGRVDARHHARASRRARDQGRPRVGQRLGRCDITMPFGGFKQSGFGRDRSLHALAQVCRPQVGLDHALTKDDFAMNVTPTAVSRPPRCIDGKWVTSADDLPGAPIRQRVEKLADVPDPRRRGDALRAIDAAAARAFPPGRRKTAKERAQILRRWFDLITAETEALAQLMTTEQGKPLGRGARRGRLRRILHRVVRRGRKARLRHAPSRPRSARKRYVTIKQPIGVVAAIAPWNFPIAMITRKVAPALAAGCTIVVKPAEETPLCALAIAKLALDAGVPAGVFNIVTTTRCARRRQGALRRRARAQAVVHGLDRRRQGALPPVRRHREEAHARAWRQRAADRVRRRRSRARPSPAPWPRSTATPARRACAPIASSCSPASTTASRPR